MNLETLYHEVAEAISRLDLNSIWPGFKPFKFALFDAEKCFYDGRYVEKTDAFCANTSIVYEGEQTATWMVAEELPIPILTSKIVHEMFHGFQNRQGWDCWPDEIEALFRYEFNAENISIKLRENELLLALLGGFDKAAFDELLSLRKLRSKLFPYQFSYEIRTEEIEGAANFVEWKVLKQLDDKLAIELTGRMRTATTNPERLFPIRISCYYTGALMINALLAAGEYSFDPPARPVMLGVLDGIEPHSEAYGGKEASMRLASREIAAYNAETEAIIKSALDRNDIVLNGPLGLGYVNVYNARRHGEYLTSTFFLMYRDAEGDKMIPGDFVIKMQDEKTIAAVYKWEQAPH